MFQVCGYPCVHEMPVPSGELLDLHARRGREFTQDSTPDADTDSQFSGHALLWV